MIHDFLVIGGGISGASVAYELAAAGTVLVLEAESSPGYHSTGRSAALFTRNYGGPVVRQINASSASFFASPPEGFCDSPLLTPRGALTVADEENLDKLPALLALSEPGEDVIEITSEEALALAPYLRPERVASAVYEANVADIDVANLHQGYLKGIRQRGGTIATGEAVTVMTHQNDLWNVQAKRETYRAKVVVNASGAWADEIGAIVSAQHIGLVPMRRTGIILDAPDGLDLAASPAVDFAGSNAYIKPEAGTLMASPGDATPTQPQDVRPDELDIAHLAHWIETETLIPVRRISHSWAGLRSFVSDEAPVVGFDNNVPDFLWLAAQGGYGIMMAPALAKLAADLVLKRTIEEVGFDVDAISPARAGILKHR
ncbi:NAD(P)/FAD-dependent oxidoreductase [Litoreibacter roseus]|uniref:Glycerol-3-phosphate dehydrogenase n=1 Tax=Litoreibacter roseus TaxID=2601869 RepID=A0A6N6JCJ4_9RHOB|nr:FAD-dependent oxidoreductase [Litoreibacter roseus]GFE63876.1 glycerol-3-phosphate dehydrogenase [Litoreibacter roseus]